MKGIVSWFAANTVAANLLMLVAIIGGAVSFNTMEREFFPPGDINIANVSISWEGASPSDVETELVARIEEALSDLDGIKRITSVSREGVGTVTVEGENNVHIDTLLNDVERRVNQINNLPPAAFQPTVTQLAFQPPFFGLVVHGNVDSLTLKRATEQVRDDIAQLPGGQLAEIQAVLDEEVSIEVSEENLRRYGLSFAEISNAIQRSSINQSSGQVRTDTGTVGIQTRQLANDQNEFGDIIISQTTDSGIVRVRDVATVKDGFIDANLDTSYNGANAAFIFVNGPDKMDIVKFTDGFKEYIENSSKTLPQGIELAIFIDLSKDFNDRMNTITNSALLGSVLVMIVLILFLRPIVAFWVTVGIMTAFAGGTLLLPWFGVSFNLLSLFAVLLVIGVIVDDAIVVGENIHKEVETGRNVGLKAAQVGTHAVMKPVIFGVLTTIIVFLPWAFISGPQRSFTSQISFVVMAALLFSLIESLLILPAHLAHMKPQNFEGLSGALTRMQRRIADSLIWVANTLYKPVLELALRARYATVFIFVFLFVLATKLQGDGFVPFRFMPQIENDLIQVTIEMPPGTPYNRVEQVRDQLSEGLDRASEKLINQYPSIEGGFLQGISMAAFDERVQAWLTLAPPEERPKTASTKEATLLMREEVGAIPDAEDITFDFSFNDDDTRVSFSISHPDLDTLRAAADAVSNQLTTYSSLYDIGDNLSSAADELRIEMTPGAEALGISLQDVSSQIRQAYFGLQAQRLARDGEDARVMVRLTSEDRNNIDSIRNLRIRTSTGTEIPLSEVAELSYAPGINAILRRDRVRSAIIFAEVSGDQRNQIVADMDANFWPKFARDFPGVQRANAGGFEDEQAFFLEIRILMLMAFGGMYILLAVAFKSYFQPLLLMTAIPFAYAGAVFGHLVFGVPIALFSFFGIAAAGGVVINDNLVLVDYVNRRRNEGAGAIQALIDAGVSRFRPILLTSVTTFVGILPLIAERSISAQFLRPMVVALGSAVLFALFVSLLLVPALYAAGTEVGRIVKFFFGFVRKLVFGTPYTPFRPIGDRYEGEVYDDNDAVRDEYLPDARAPE